MNQHSQHPLDRETLDEIARDEVAVALCIYGAELEPGRLTDLLGAQPTHSHKRGDESGKRSVPCKTGAWILELRRVEPIDVDSMLVELFSKLPSDLGIWKELSGRHELRLDFSLHTDVGAAFCISPETFGLISSRHCAFNISVYAYGRDA